MSISAKAANVPGEHKAIIAGGSGGAGKTTVLADDADINLSEYLTINPDDIKEEMAIRGMFPELDGLSPMEAADLAHEESSHIAKRLARRAQAKGKNLIWDITMSDQSKARDRIVSLREAKYSQIDGVFVNIPLQTSIRRTEARHREGHEKYRAGDGLGGRYVPPEVIERQADLRWGSKNRETFEALKAEFNNWSVYDNSVDGRIPQIVESGK